MDSCELHKSSKTRSRNDRRRKTQRSAREETRREIMQTLIGDWSYAEPGQPYWEQSFSIKASDASGHGDEEFEFLEGETTGILKLSGDFLVGDLFREISSEKRRYGSIRLHLQIASGTLRSNFKAAPSFRFSGMVSYSDKEKQRKEQEKEDEKEPWGESIFSRRVPSVSQTQQSVDVWCELIKGRALPLHAYSDRANPDTFLIWPRSLLYLTLPERVRTMQVSSGFRIANLKSIDHVSSVAPNDLGRLRNSYVLQSVVCSLATSVSLEIVDLRRAKGLDNNTMLLLAKACTSLQSFKFCFEYQNKALNHVAIEAVAELACERLTEVEIVDFNSSIANQRSELGELDELELGEATLTKLLKRVGNRLSALSLAGWPLSVAMQHEVGKSCPNLQRLSLSDPSKLCCGSCVTPDGLAAIAEGCINLQALSLQEADNAISEASLVAVSKNCPELVELDLSGRWDEFSNGMSSVTDAVMVAALNCGMAKLQTVDLYMTEASDPTLFALASSCPNLRRVDLSTSASDSEGEGYGVWYGGSERLFTDEGIVSLAKSCYKLEWLNLHMCCKIGDTAILAVARHCKELRFLDMSGGDMTDTEEGYEAEEARQPIPHKYAHFTDASIYALQTGCPKLSTLCIALCPAISKRSLEDLKASHPNVEICTTRGRRGSCLEILSTF